MFIDTPKYHAHNVCDQKMSTLLDNVELFLPKKVVMRKKN